MANHATMHSGKGKAVVVTIYEKSCTRSRKPGMPCMLVHRRMVFDSCYIVVAYQHQLGRSSCFFKGRCWIVG